VSRYAVGLLLVAGVGALAWMLWPSKPAPAGAPAPGGKPGKTVAAWTPGQNLGNAVAAISGNRAAGDRAASVVASNAAKALAAVDKARGDAGASFSNWLAGVTR